MARAKIVKELLVKTGNKVGMLAAVTETIAKSGANITALNAFGVDKDAIFRIITSDNAKAINANKAGEAAQLGNKLKAANIDVIYIYGSTCDCGGPSTIIFNCSDNKKAVEILNK